MSDSSDDDDLEALRLEALKSLKPRDPAITESQKSKQPQEHFSESRRSLHSSRENDKISEDRNQYRIENSDKVDHYTDFRLSAKSHHSSSWSSEKTSSARNREFVKHDAEFKYDSSRRNTRNFNSSRMPFRSNSRRRNPYSRRSHSPDERSNCGTNYRSSDLSLRKYPTRHRNQKSVSPPSRRKSRSPCLSNQKRDRTSASKNRISESVDSLSSLPLCSPKHYVELFYGKKLSTNNLDIEGGPGSLILNEEDCALLSEKSNLESAMIKSASIETLLNKSPENCGPSKESNRKLHQDESMKETSRVGKRSEEDHCQKVPSSTKSSRIRDRYPSERSAPQHPRRLNARNLHETKLDGTHPMDRLSSDLRSSKKKKFDEKADVGAAKMNEPPDPVLEARRKKFESNDIVKAVSKRIKLTNQPAFQNPVPTDESDLRNLLLAKHRVKVLSAVSFSKDHSSCSEDHQNLSVSSPLIIHSDPESSEHLNINSNLGSSEFLNIHSDLESSEFSSRPLIVDNGLVLNSQSEQSHLEVNYSDQTNCSTNDQVKIKEEVVTQEIAQIHENVPPENFGTGNSSELPAEGIDTDFNVGINYGGESFASKDDVPRTDCVPRTENVPIFESTDFLGTAVVKDEPLADQCEENPIVEEEKPFIDEPDLIPQQPDKVEDTSSSAPFIKIKPLTELLDKKVLKKVKKSKKDGEKKSKKRKKKSKSKDKDRHKESRISKLSKHTSKNLSQNLSRTEPFPTRLVRSALEEALGKKKRKVFENDDSTLRKTNFENHAKKDSRKVLILETSSQEEMPGESSPPVVVSTEHEHDDSSEESQDERMNFRLSSEAPLYSSKKRKKKPDIYRMIQLNQV